MKSAAKTTIVALAATLSCGMFNEPSEIDPCDPIKNYYDGKTHYIEREFVREDGTLDYDLMFEKLKPESSPCATNP
jgi:hypothetical protein